MNQEEHKAGQVKITTMNPKSHVNGSITVCMSMPRLAFTNNMMSVNKAITTLGMDVDIHHGAFWGQGLTWLMEARKEHPQCKYILTVDYDTWFTWQHVYRLFQLMEANPDIDILAPVQTKRDDNIPMFTMGPDDYHYEFLKTHFHKPLTRVFSIHFGLTLIRVDSFSKLSKPWFKPLPDPQGSWNDGRIDEDIYFWYNAWENKLKVYMANEVVIGHLQLIATFAGNVDVNWSPTHIYVKKLIEQGPGAGIIPDITKVDNLTDRSEGIYETEGVKRQERKEACTQNSNFRKSLRKAKQHSRQPRKKQK